MSIVAPDPTLEFLSLFGDQTEDVIMSRCIDWANEGLDPVADAEDWVDTREGGHWRTVITPPIREIARLYDLAGTEVPMSAFVLWAWGTYLDDLGNVFDVYRLPSTSATGTVEFLGPDGTIIALGTTVSTTPVGPDDPAPTFQVTAAGTLVADVPLDLPVQATEAGIAGNVAAGAIDAQSTPLPGVTFANQSPTLGGTDPETDDSFRNRILEALKGKGPGTASDLVRWASAYAGVGRATVGPAWHGAGTALVMVTQSNGQPLDTSEVDTIQAGLDPVPGQGQGQAPIGQAITVHTSTILPVVINATTQYQTGYSADGASGTAAVRASVETALQAYLLTVAPGEDIVYEHVKGIIATTVGVHDVTAMTLNGGTVNVVVDIDPPEAPSLTTPIGLT